MSDNQQQSGLVRALGPIDATMIVIGSMIGSGIFITSAESARLSGAPGWLLLAWAIAGLLTITGALCCSELATMMPRAGGVYVFLREAYGKSIGFLYGWTLFLVIQTGTIAAVAIAFAKFLGVFVAGLALALLLGKSMVGPLFAQTAWTNVTFIGSEIRDPGKNLVRALVIGCASVVILYLLANLAYIAVLPFPEIQHAPHNRVAVAMMNSIFGRPGAMCMAAAIMISTFGCNNGLILSGARVYYAMARDRLFFKRVGTTNRFHVPAAALVAQGIWTALLTLPRRVTIDATTHKVAYGNVYNQLLEYIVSADLLFYLLMVVAVMILRRTKPEAERPYRTWGYPIVPIISILVAGLLIVDLGFLAPATSGIGILIALTGLPAYFFWRRISAEQLNE